MADIVLFEAKTASFPNAIDLDWALSENLGPTEEVRIRRSESIYPLSTEGTEIFITSDSTRLSFRDSGLGDGLFYYYTAFIYDTATMIYREFGRVSQSFSLSYKNWGEGERLYKLIPVGIRRLDELNDFHLAKLFSVIGNMMDYFKSYVCTLSYFRRPDLVAENQLDFYSLMFGFAPERGFDLRVLRNIAQSIIGIYKRKGTCAGLRDFIKAFTTWDSQCDDEVDLTFRWWDPDTKRNLGFLTGTAARTAIDTNANFTPNVWQNGKFVDPLDDPFFKILSNTATEISFDFKTPHFTRLDGTAGQGLDAITFEDLTQAWTPDEWRGYRLYINSFSSTEYFTIISNTATQLTVNPKKTNFGTPPVYIDVGLDDVAPGLVNYRIEPEYYVQQGRHSLTFDNTVPPGFRGTSKDPAHFYVGGSRSLLSLGQFSELAVLVIIEGVADFVGRSTGLAGGTLTDTNANFGGTNNLVGKKINPNVLQAQDFTIIANTPTTVDVAADLTQVAAAGNNYYILDEFDSIKARRLREVMPEFAPRDVDLFLFFEPKP